MMNPTQTLTKVPELLAPAGGLEKLKVALSYGADAVYLGGQKFGLRAAADNFTPEELLEAVQFAHKEQRKVYVVLNGFLHDKDLDELPEFVQFLDEINVDAVIVSDVGVAQVVRRYSGLPIHVSTQASVLNVGAAKMWKSLGATRVIVGRELSIKQAGQIKREAQIEVEMFIHGSMCMAYSGHCVISNFTQGRDSNRGGCAHSCRFEYSLSIKDLDTTEKKHAYFMSSKDLQGIRLLEEFIQEDIDSIKVEGRMKSPLYAATMSKIYAEALDYYRIHGHFLSEKMLEWEAELSKVSHRAYTEASLSEKANATSIFNEREADSELEWEIAGVVLEITSNSMIVEVKNAFNQGDVLELLPFVGAPVVIPTFEMVDLNFHPLQRTKPSTLIRLPHLPEASSRMILRQRKKT